MAEQGQNLRSACAWINCFRMFGDRIRTCSNYYLCSFAEPGDGSRTKVLPETRCKDASHHHDYLSWLRDSKTIALLCALAAETLLLLVFAVLFISKRKKNRRKGPYSQHVQLRQPSGKTRTLSSFEDSTEMARNPYLSMSVLVDSSSDTCSYKPWAPRTGSLNSVQRQILSSRQTANPQIVLTDRKEDDVHDGLAKILPSSNTDR